MNSGFLHRGGAWVVIQSALMIAVLVVAPIWAGAWQGVWSQVAAAVLGGLGAFFGLSGVLVLGRSRTIFPEPLAQAQLVVTGVYAIVRHPLYTSMIFLSVAWALWWCSLPGLVLALGYIGFLDAKARYEEKRLHLRFRDYPDYCRRVKRLLPWIY